MYAQLHLRFITNEDADKIVQILRKLGHDVISEHAVTGNRHDHWNTVRVTTEDER